MYRPALSPNLRRTVVAVAVVGLGFASFAPATAAPSKAQPLHASVNTYRSWDKSSSICCFGRPNTSTYGQVITIPAGKTTLNKFNFYMTDFGATGSMVVRGEVYAWDGSKATGSAVAETPAQTLSYGDTSFHKVKFNAGGAAVTSGSQYVIFASVSKDYEACTDGYTNAWGSTDDSAYGLGTFVYLNDTGDESQWTTTTWNTFGLDLAFKAYLS